MNVHGVELRDFKKDPLQVLSFGAEILTENQSSCDSGRCFL